MDLQCRCTFTQAVILGNPHGRCFSLSTEEDMLCDACREHCGIEIGYVFMPLPTEDRL